MSTHLTAVVCAMKMVDNTVVSKIKFSSIYSSHILKRSSTINSFLSLVAENILMVLVKNIQCKFYSQSFLA